MVEDFRTELYSDRIFVLTPNGELKNLIEGATPLDFAYAIHTEVGERCAGARVNGKLVSLRHPLDDGDTVEIRTSANQMPRKDWLEFVISGKARSRIRHAIRYAEKERSRELGKEILDRELRRAGFSLRRLLEAGDLDEVACEANPLVNMDEIGLQTLEEGFDHPLDDRIPSSGVMIEEDVIPVQPVHFETVHIVLFETGLLPRNLAARQQADLQPRPLLGAAQILHIGFHPPRALGRELMNDVNG